MIPNKDGQFRLRQKLLFLQQYLRRPFGVGAIAPSGQQLAQLMVKSAAVLPTDVIVELGPGTGVFTSELLVRGADAAQLMLVETDAVFVRHLKKKFPEVHVVEGDAMELRLLVAQHLGVPRVSKMISGIPLRSLKPSKRKSLAREIAAILDPGGVLVQFSYFKASPLPKALTKEVGLTGQFIGMVKSNLPPAYVWKYVKAD